jgi:hypothetical protein
VEETDACREKNPEVGQEERSVASKRLMENKRFNPREPGERKQLK